MPIRCDEWEQTEICWNGSSMTNNNGFTAAALPAPLLPLDLVARLSRARLTPPGSVLAYVNDGHGPQPVCCLLARNLRDDLRSYLGGGGRTPRDWFRRHRPAVADCRDMPTWSWSLNTFEEWILAERQVAEHKRA